MIKKTGIVLLLVLAAQCVGRPHRAVPTDLSSIAFADTMTNDGQPCPPECVTDTMVWETYYPSPYGLYEELRGDKIIVGDTAGSVIGQRESTLPPPGTLTFNPLTDEPTSLDGTLYEGSLYYKKSIGATPGKLRYYDGSIWNDLGGAGDYWKPSTANSNDIYYNTGNVGIGVGENDAIGAKLQINTSSGAKGLVVKSGVNASLMSSTTFDTTGGPYSYPVPTGITQVTITAYGAQ